MKYVVKLFILIIFLGLLGSDSYAQRKKSKRKKTKVENIEEGTDLQKLQFAFGQAIRFKTIQDLTSAMAYFQECIKLEPKLAAAYFEMSQIYHQLNERENALEYAKTAAELETDNYWYAMLYLESLEKLNRNRDALKVAQELSKKHPSDNELTLKVAFLYFTNDDYLSGIKIINEYESKYGPSVQLLQAKKAAYLRMADMVSAANEIRKLIDLDPYNENHYLDLADVMRAIGKKEEANEVFNELKEKYPNESRIHLLLAEYYNKEGESEKSFQELIPVFEDASIDIDVKMNILLSFFDVINRFPEFKDHARELNEILVKVHPNEAKSHTIYGDFLYNDKELEKAKYHFRKAVELDNSRFAIWNQLIIIEAEQEHYDSVIAVVNEAAELFPNQPSLFYYSGIAYSQLEEYDQAVNEYERGRMMIIDNDRMEVQFFLGLGEAYNELKKFKESDESFNRALAMDPNNANALNNYAYYLSLRGERLDDAEKMSSKSNELVKNQSSYLDTYAWILYQQGKYEKAAVWIEKAIEHGGRNSGEVLEHAGDIYFKLGSKTQAMEYWNKAQTKGGVSELLEKKIEDHQLYE